MLAAKGIEKRYGTVAALRGASLSLSSGSITGLIGANGAGKSTLLRILAGLMQPDSGGVFWDDSPKPATSADRERIGIAPQEIAMYPSLTGMENLRFFGRLFGKTKADAMRAIDLVGLGHKADSRVATYSGGMQRRLNLALALIGDPEVLLLDEPMAGVDPVCREDLHAVLRGLASDGLAILIATHLLEDANRLCNDVAILRDGRVSTSTSTGVLSAEGLVFKTPDVPNVPDMAQRACL